MSRALPVAFGVVVLALGQGGCNGAGTTPAPTAVPDGPEKPEPKPDAPTLELRLEQPAELDGLVLTWLSVEDSRCPQGVTCVWAGEATVRIRVRDGTEDSEIALKLGPPAGDDVVKTARHEFRLLAVDPYPRHDTQVARDAYRASLSVKRR